MEHSINETIQSFCKQFWIVAIERFWRQGKGLCALSLLPRLCTSSGNYGKTTLYWDLYTSTRNINEFKQEKCSKLQTSRSLLLPLKKYWKKKREIMYRRKAQWMCSWNVMMEWRIMLQDDPTRTPASRWAWLQHFTFFDMSLNWIHHESKQQATKPWFHGIGTMTLLSELKLVASFKYGSREVVVKFFICVIIRKNKFIETCVSL